MFLRNELPERARDKQLKLITLFAPEHLALPHRESFSITESAGGDFFNDPTRQRCQLACNSLLTAALMPSCASEITNLTPRKPRRASLRRNAVQNGSASEGPTSMPRISRRPSALTPTATITATETMRPWLRTFT